MKAQPHKLIKHILGPPAFHMVGDGFRVHNFFPALPEVGLHGMSPFFLMDYNSPWLVPPGDRPRGVGVHPHRGLETVTIAFSGRIAHHDSAGNADVIGEGDVQWMTAGGGVLHKEYHEKDFSRTGGLFHMVQLWVNLPAKDKMTPAKYQPILRRQMGAHLLDDKKSVVEVIAGKFHEASGPAFCFSPIELYIARLVMGSTVDFSFPESNNSAVLVASGQVIVNQKSTAKADHLVYFEHTGEVIAIEATEDSLLLIMSGQPINEPISAYGPFLMNTRQEIQKAYEDYYAGKFGILED